MNCIHFGLCGGCPLGGVAYEQTLAEKTSTVKNALGVSPLVAPFPSGRVRDRAELIWQDGILGFYKKDVREVVDVTSCPMLSEKLDVWLAEYRLRAPPIQQGTVRLRVSPAGQRGAWLDFANWDVKILFDEKKYLEWLSERAIVEIGQRRKRLAWKDDQPKLVDPELFPWFETYGRDGRRIPLFGVIGGFTQVGFRCNRALVDRVVGCVRSSGLEKWTELFAGSGNFSLALTDHGFSVDAYENDGLAVQALNKSRQQSHLEELAVHQVDVYHHPHKVGSLKGRGLLVDPPRSGLGKLLDWLSELPGGELPAHVIYVSCFTDTFLADLERLKALGYSLKQVEGVDQFPRSPHMEWVSSLSGER